MADEAPTDAPEIFDDLYLGAFSVGTFGLGFTLGGLIFGKWRKA
jgi:hypothetical protein